MRIVSSVAAAWCLRPALLVLREPTLPPVRRFPGPILAQFMLMQARGHELGAHSPFVTAVFPTNVLAVLISKFLGRREKVEGGSGSGGRLEVPNRGPQIR